MSISSQSFRRLVSTFAVLGALLVAAGGAAAADTENPSGPYVGAGYGEFDREARQPRRRRRRAGGTGQRRFRLPGVLRLALHPYISLEADYVDLGNPRGNFDATGSSGDYEVELAGFAGYVIGSLPIGIFELSAKVGYYFHDVDLTRRPRQHRLG